MAEGLVCVFVAEGSFGAGVADDWTGLKVEDGLVKVAVSVGRFSSRFDVNVGVVDPCPVIATWLVSSDRVGSMVPVREGLLVLSSPAIPKWVIVLVKVALGRKGVSVDVPPISRYIILTSGLQAADNQIIKNKMRVEDKKRFCIAGILSPSR